VIIFDKLLPAENVDLRSLVPKKTAAPIKKTCDKYIQFIIIVENIEYYLVILTFEVDCDHDIHSFSIIIIISELLLCT